jgi:hypothetical protein
MPLVLFALFWGWPKNTAAATESRLGSPLLFDQTASTLTSFAACLEGKQSFALAEQLDDIASSTDYRRLLSGALRELERIDTHELTRARLEFEFSDLHVRVGHQLRPLLARVYAALVATWQIVPEEWVKDAIVAAEDGEGGLWTWLNDMDEPVRMRRYLRHIFRGNAALMCVPFVANDEHLQRELLVHAAIGAETDLRFAAAASPNRALALDLLEQLRLEPIDLEELERHRDELTAARDSLREAQHHVPGFRLPPDPSFQK